MTEEFKKEVALENEKKRKETEGRPSKENCTPIGVQNTDDNRSRSNTWTDSQTAKKAGVGVGTVAVEYVKLCGYGNGGDRKAQAQVGHVLSLEEIANQLGTSKTNLKRALSIERNLIHRLYEVSQNIFKSY